MSYPSIQPYFARGLPVLLVAIGLALGAARGPTLLAAPHEPADVQPRLQVVLVNADGADPKADFALRDVQPEADFWLLGGTRLERPLQTPIRYENSVIDGFTLQPATRAALRTWFEDAAQHLRPGDTLLFYVTDHGTKNAADLTNNRITLWGAQESLSVTELRELFARLDPRVRIVLLMSQCYSGAFANLMYPDVTGGLPAGNVCGFFASPADRQAYGCYPENRDRDNVGHSFAFIESLATGDSLSEAHHRVLVTDQPPDVPLKTSDVYLERLLEGAGRERGQGFEALVDALLGHAWHDTGVWEQEIRLLDGIGQAFGSFRPRSMAELQEHARFLPDISEQFTTYSKAWEASLHALATANLERFLTRKPGWRERLDDQALAALETAERRTLAHTLLTDLADFTRTDTATKARLQLLQEKTNSAAKAYYRMQGRLGVVLRMRTLLTSIAGRVYLTQDDRAEQRQSYERLRACEALTLGDAHVAVSPPVPPEPFPSYGEELKLAEAVLPGPPTVGSDVLPLRDLTSYRGTLPVALTSGGPYLLFFWATWCAPCKASLPEVVAFERASGIPVVAITDEPPAKLDAFFNKYNAPFPAIVAVDELRKAFLAYGVSGTPTFVLADAAGKVQSVTVGYRTEVGLALPGWSGNRPNPAPTQESRP